MTKEAVRDGFVVGSDGAASEIFGSTSMPGTPEYSEPVDEENPLASVERFVTSAVSRAQEILRALGGEDYEPEPAVQRHEAASPRPAEKPAKNWPPPTVTATTEPVEEMPKSALDEALDKFKDSQPSLEEQIVYRQLVDDHDNPGLIEVFIETHEDHLSPALVELLRLAMHEKQARHDEAHRNNIFE